MSTNASSSLRRILRSIGRHATPTGIGSGSSGGPPVPNKRCDFHASADRLSGRSCGSRRVSQSFTANDAEDRAWYSDTRYVRPCGTKSSRARPARWAPRRGDLGILLDGEGEHSSVASRSAPGYAKRGAGTCSLATTENHEEGKNIKNVRKTQHPPTEGPDSGANIGTIRSGSPDHSDLDVEFEAIVSTSSVRMRDGKQPRVRGDDSFRKRFHVANRKEHEDDAGRSARRKEIDLERHAGHEPRWRDILRLLEHRKLSDPQAFAKRTETIKLPQGVRATWTRDPGESILQVMQQTGSHLQALPGQSKGALSEFTLFGTPSQNKAAKELLQMSDLLQALSEDDLNASKSLADYDVRIELANGDVPSLEEAHLRTRQPELQETNEFAWQESLEQSQLETAVDDATSKAPTRAVWAHMPDSRTGTSTLENRGTKLGHGLTLVSGAPTSVSPVALTNRIKDLTALRPRLVPQKKEGFILQGHLYKYVRDELVRLLLDPQNTSSITAEALTVAIAFLARHMFFPSIRNIMHALDNAKIEFDASVFDPLLDAAARSESINTFFYLVYLMRKRNIEPVASTWIHFHTLMTKRFPADAPRILDRIREHSVGANRSARIDVMEAYARVLFRAYLAEYPNATIEDFISRNNKGLPGLKWMTTYYANQMITVLLEQSKTSQAFEVVDQLVKRGGRPDTVTLNLFLRAADYDGNLEMAIAVLRKFHMLQSSREALSESIQAQSTTSALVIPDIRQPERLQITRNLRLKPNANTYKHLLDNAWNRKSYNTFRVFWRYACCAGHMPKKYVDRMNKSIKSDEGWDMEKDDHDAFEAIGANERVQPPRRALWQAWGARFAVGVSKCVVRDKSPSTHEKALPAQSGEVVPAPEVDELIRKVGAVKNDRQKFIGSAIRTLYQDLRSVGSLRPEIPLAEMAQTAWEKDRAWKSAMLGLPQGLKNYQKWRQMYQDMAHDGVQVPFEKGDGTGMRL